MEEWCSLPFAPAAGTTLCKLGEIPEPGGKEVVPGEGDYVFRIVVFRFKAGARIPQPLRPCSYSPQLGADEFHEVDDGVLMCAHHGALYRIAEGFCFEGPCEGASLAPIAVSVGGGDVILD